jgi:hypothetical protein
MPNQTTYVDIGLALERWQRTAATLTQRHLELYAAAVARLADAHVEAVRATRLVPLLPLAERHAAIWRECAETYVTTMRGLIDR